MSNILSDVSSYLKCRKSRFEVSKLTSEEQPWRPADTIAEQMNGIVDGSDGVASFYRIRLRQRSGGNHILTYFCPSIAIVSSVNKPGSVGDRYQLFRSCTYIHKSILGLINDWSREIDESYIALCNVRFMFQHRGLYLYPSLSTSIASFDPFTTVSHRDLLSDHDITTFVTTNRACGHRGMGFFDDDM